MSNVDIVSCGLVRCKPKAPAGEAIVLLMLPWRKLC